MNRLGEPAKRRGRDGAKRDLQSDPLKQHDMENRLPKIPLLAIVNVSQSY